MSELFLLHLQPEQQWATYYDEPTFEDELEDDFESEEDFDDETYSRKGSKRKKNQPGRKPKVCIVFASNILFFSWFS